MNSGNDRLSYGITILVFGFIFLLDKLGLLAQIPYANRLLSVSCFLLIAGIVFLCTQPKRALGWVFLVVGVILNADFFLGWMQNYSRYLVPIALILVGIIMVFSSKRK